jgi:hypothetical protein
MPRMQIYLPDDLYDEVKARKLPASELLQNAVRAELRRLKLIDEAEQYLKEMIDEFGEPDPADIAWAEDFVADIKKHRAAYAAKVARRSQPEPDTKAG